MNTEVLHVNPTDPEPAIVARAAEVLKRGGLVAFPTETVYGLGARAFDAAAVSKIFAAKGRPANNPLIVHYARLPFSPNDASASRYWPDSASILAAQFWPGPLTLVLPKPPDLPDIVTAGRATWAVRVPDHAVSHALIRVSGPLAAPSANVSSGISATTAEHVLSSLGGRIDLVLDGGACPGGIESTVLDLTTTPPQVLRPGPILPGELRALLGEVLTPNLMLEGEAPKPSPGTSIRHYAPRATLAGFADDAEAHGRADELGSAGKQVEWLRLGGAPAPRPYRPERVLIHPMPEGSAAYAAVLYDTLHSADQRGADWIVVSLPPASEEWLAVRDRLRRAATVWKAH